MGLPTMSSVRLRDDDDDDDAELERAVDRAEALAQAVRDEEIQAEWEADNDDFFFGADDEQLEEELWGMYT